MPDSRRRYGAHGAWSSMGWLALICTGMTPLAGCGSESIPFESGAPASGGTGDAQGSGSSFSGGGGAGAADPGAAGSGAGSGAAGFGAAGSGGTGDDPSGSIDVGGSSGSGATCSTTVSANDATNLRFTGQLDLSVVSVKPESDLTLEWSTVTHDIFGRAVDPATDLGAAGVMLFSFTPDELRDKLLRGRIDTSKVDHYFELELEDGPTSARLFDLGTLADAHPEPEDILKYFEASTFPPSDHTYALLVTTGPLLGGQLRAVQAFKLDETSTNTTVKVTDESSTYSYAADLSSIPPTTVLAGSAELALDTTQLSKDAQGEELVRVQLTEVRISHFDETPAYEQVIESQIFDLDRTATTTYRGPVNLRGDTSLAELTTDDDQPFEGITNEGIWVLGLYCTDCWDPIPRYMTILEPCADWTERSAPR